MNPITIFACIILHIIVPFVSEADVMSSLHYGKNCAKLECLKRQNILFFPLKCVSLAQFLPLF
jgi:hypothetical protein